MMTLGQTKLVGLIMKLDLKAREYKMLCDKLDQAKQNQVDPNGPEMLELLNEFQENNKEIVEIKRRLIELRDSEEEVEIETLSDEQEELLEQYGLEALFKKNQKATIDSTSQSVEIITKDQKKNIFSILLDKIKRLLRI